jgi:sulfate adenylyltransferase subunit 1
MIHAPAAAVAATEVDELTRLRAFEADLNALVRKHFPHWGAKDVLDLLK